jgi:hypothetical protein
VALLAETFLGRYVVRLYLAHASLPPPRGPGHPGAFELASFAFYSKSVLYGAFVRARGALNRHGRWLPSPGAAGAAPKVAAGLAHARGAPLWAEVGARVAAARCRLTPAAHLAVHHRGC